MGSACSPSATRTDRVGPSAGAGLGGEHIGFGHDAARARTVDRLQVDAVLGRRAPGEGRRVDVGAVGGKDGRRFCRHRLRRWRWGRWRRLSSVVRRCTGGCCRRLGSDGRNFCLRFRRAGGRRRRLGLGCRGLCGRCSRRRGSRSRCDHRESCTDRDGLTFGGHDLREPSGCRRRDFDVDLVGGHLDKWLTLVDSVAHGLEPAGHDAFGYGLTHRREGQRNRVSHA